MIRIGMLVVTLSLLSGNVILAQEPPPVEPSEVPVDQPPPPPNPAAVDGEPLIKEEPASPDQKKPPNPCAVRAVPGEELLDQYRREIFETVCETAARFDGFFGNRRFDEEARRTSGRAGLRVLWDERDGVELDGTLKVKVDFPNLDHRVNAFLGREDRDNFVTGSDNDLDFLPTFFEREGDEEWLLGLGWRPVRGAESSLDVDGGVEFGSPVDPFVRARYRYSRVVGGENMLRARQTVYWTNEKELGSSTRVDLERPFGTRTLARWTGNVTFDELTEGADWNSGVTLYHGFTPHRALAWYVGANGETGREVPLEDYGTRFTYRQRMLREWFFGEVITGVTWPRETLAEQRELAFHIGFGFEIQFSGKDLGLR